MPQGEAELVAAPRARAVGKICNIVRHSAVAQFGDLVEFEHAGDGRPWRYQRQIASAGYRRYGVESAAVVQTEIQLAIQLRIIGHGLVFEAWSTVMTYTDPTDPVPRSEAGRIVGAIALPPAPDDREGQLRRAHEILEAAAREFGVSLHSAELALAAGDELAAARHRRALRKGAA